MRLFICFLFLMSAYSCDPSEKKIASGPSPKDYLAKLNKLPLPFYSRYLLKNVDLEAVLNDTISNEMALQMGLKDSLGIQPSRQFIHWGVGVLYEGDKYISAIFGYSHLDRDKPIPSGVNIEFIEGTRYILATFTKEGKLISKLLIADFVLQGCCTISTLNSVINENGEIELSIRDEEYDEVSLYEASIKQTRLKYKASSKGEIKLIEKRQGSVNPQRSFYGIKDYALLSILKLNEKSFYYDLKIRPSKGTCEFAFMDTATLNENGQYVSEDAAGCLLYLELKDKVITIKPKDDQEERCYKPDCGLKGNFIRLSDSAIQVAKFRLLQWPRMTADKFGCLLEERFNYKDEKFNCSLKNYIYQGDPSSENYYEGPEFPSGKAKLIHPAIKSVDVEFEHGDLRSLTVTLEKKMLIQEIQRIFLLPNQKQLEAYGYLNYEIRYDGSEPLVADPYKPVMTDMFIISGFDHQGAGD